MASSLIRGIPQTRAALERVKLEIEAAAPAAVAASGEVVASEMASRAPVDTGATAGSVRVSVDSVGYGATAHVGPTTSYARFREFGTIYVTALHWMEGAALSSIPGIVGRMAAVFKAAVE